MENWKSKIGISKLEIGNIEDWRKNMLPEHRTISPLDIVQRSTLAKNDHFFSLSIKNTKRNNMSSVKLDACYLTIGLSLLNLED